LSPTEQPRNPEDRPPLDSSGQERAAQRIRYVTHRGKRILLADVSDCTAEQLGEWIDKVPQFVTREPERSVLLLGDFSGAQFTRETVERLKIAAVFDRPHVLKAAWVLNQNLPKVLFDSIRTFSAREIPVFATREEALDYLAS